MPPAAASPWAFLRSPIVIIVAGCAIAMISFGPRSSFGFFLQPMSAANGWGRDVFALAFALQNLLWGLGQPVAGAIADRYGTARVLAGGAVLYTLGLALMVYSSTPSALHLSAGVLIGFGLSGCSFNLVLGAFGKLVPQRLLPVALGAGTAAGSFGQFLFAPFGVAMIQNYGWQTALFMFGGLTLLIVPFAIALMTRGNREHSGETPTAASTQTLKQAVAEAFGHRSFVLLSLGFFTCGFQLAFITAHLPAYLIDRGLNASVGGWTIAIIGLFNIAGSLGAGVLGSYVPKRFILVGIYLVRAVSIAIFITLPPSVEATLAFGIITGLTWLSTVPPTSALVALMFGTRWFAMLYGFVFVSHQFGSFLGVYFGGVVFEQFGSYQAIWWLSVAFGVISAIINWPIVEKPVVRPVAAGA